MNETEERNPVSESSVILESSKCINPKQHNLIEENAGTGLVDVQIEETYDRTVILIPQAQRCVHLIQMHMSVWRKFPQ